LKRIDKKPLEPVSTGFGYEPWNEFQGGVGDSRVIHQQHPSIFGVAYSIGDMALLLGRLCVVFQSCERNLGIV
jgi:hypothetical protein